MVGGRGGGRTSPTLDDETLLQCFYLEVNWDVLFRKSHDV